MTIKPVTPDEASKTNRSSIPEAIIQAVNEILSEKFTGGGSVDIKQDDILARACKIDPKLKNQRSKIFDNGWMDIEPVFEKAGWTVKYDKPAYCESYDAFFTFSKKRKK
jgi:hypothetical protein